MEEDHGEERVPPSGGHLGPGGHLRGLRPRVPARAPAPRRALRAVAQLAERLHGMQEVRGSNPLSSTSHFASTAPALAAVCQQIVSRSPAAAVRALLALTWFGAFGGNSYLVVTATPT